MTFLYPFSLVALVGIFFFLLSLRTQNIPEIPVGSLELWQQQEPVFSGYKPRLSSLLTLFLSILLYILINLALANPLVFIEKRREVLCVLDCSASMQTKFQKIRFFDLAVSSLKNMLQTLHPQNDSVELILYPQEERYYGLPDFIEKKLDTIVPCDWGGDLSEFLEKLRWKEHKEVYLFSDGTEHLDSRRFANLNSFWEGSDKSDNLGFVAWQARRIEKDQYEIFAIIENFSETSVQAELRLTIENEKIEEEKMIFLPKSTYPWTKIFSLPSGKRIKLELLYEDNFPLDNTIFTLTHEGLKIWISPESPSFLQALPRFLPGLESSEKTKADFCLQPCNQGGWLLHHSKTNINLNIAKEKKAVFLASGDPILWGVYPEMIEIEDFFSLQHPFPPDTQILLDSDKGPVIAYGEKWLFLGMPLEKSNWPLSPSFPIFWSNVFEFFAKNHSLLNFYITGKQYNHPGYYDSENKKIGVSFLHPQESNNIQKNQGNPFTEKQSSSSSGLRSIKEYVLFVAILIAGILWKLEQNYNSKGIL